MDIIQTANIFHVNQKVIGNWEGQTYWRVSMTTNAPVKIDYNTLIGLAMQLGLTEADVTAVIGTKAFPAQLCPPGAPPRKSINAQWAYKPVVTALLALGEAKLNNHAQ